MNRTIEVPGSGPLVFPDYRSEMLARAREFRLLSPEARIREIVALMALGHRMVNSSPRREAIECRWTAQELEWQRAQQIEIAKHAR